MAILKKHAKNWNYMILKIDDIKSIITLALPLMAAFLAQKGMQLIDTIMMGWIGPDALAAGAIGTSIYITTLLFCMGVLSAIGIFIVRAKGANDLTDTKASLLHGLCLAILISLPCMLIIWFTPHMLIILGQSAEVVRNVILLLHGLVFGFPGFLLFLVLREFTAAFSLTKVVMMVALGSIPLTFCLNYLLIYGRYGFPTLGIAGIGYAGACIMWLMFFCLFFYCKKNITLKNYLSFANFTFNASKLYDMLYIGIPSGILLVFEAGMFLCAAIMMGYFGVTALAAHQIAMQCASLTYAIPFALSMATALKVGHAMGEKNSAKAARYAYLGISIGLLASTIIAAIFIFMPDKLVNIFLNGHEQNYSAIKHLSIAFLLTAAIFQWLDGVQGVAIGALRGLKDTFVPMLISLGCYWFLGVGSAYYFAFHWGFNARGIWYGLTTGLCSIGIMLMIRLVYKLKLIKNIDITKSG